MEYELSGGAIVELLQKSGVKENANRYLTSVMNILFQPGEPFTIETKNMPKDQRYILLKALYIFNYLSSNVDIQYISEAVRNTFHLTEEELETKWTWLHTVMFAKRRTSSAKKKERVNKSANQ